LLAGEEQDNLLLQLHTAKQQVTELATLCPPLQPLVTLLEEAAIQIGEVSDELRHFTDQLEPDPQQLAELEQRLTRQLSLARKHHVAPQELPQLHQQLLAEQDLLARQEDDKEALTLEVEHQYQEALKIAQQLHQQRHYCAGELSQQLTSSLHRLAMPHGELQISLHFDPQHLTAEGADRVEFLVTTNPGMPLQPLARVASGGELSRIALAIQVITARKTETPALIFDEVDVGISGQTAAIVGELLRQLGESTQVICVTHLPQVAAKGHQHYFVSKEVVNEITETAMQALNKKQRLQELARLLGGDQITRNTLANARDLLAA
ncbi:MAG: DNA repair protein RecN, partial [Enterobacteriaceae bacterium]